MEWNRIVLSPVRAFLMLLLVSLAICLSFVATILLHLPLLSSTCVRCVCKQAATKEEYKRPATRLSNHFQFQLVALWFLLLLMLVGWLVQLLFGRQTERQEINKFVQYRAFVHKRRRRSCQTIDQKHWNSCICWTHCPPPPHSVYMSIQVFCKAPLLLLGEETTQQETQKKKWCNSMKKLTSSLLLLLFAIYLTYWYLTCEFLALHPSVFQQHLKEWYASKMRILNGLI